MIRLDHQKVLELLPDRDACSHKGHYGRVLLLCGSRGYTGAAALAAMGALRGGAGLVYLGVPASIYTIEAVKLTEPIVFPLQDEDGMLCAAALEEVDCRLPAMDGVLVGPGLGRSDGVRAVVQHVLSNFKGPVILDADGINAVCEHKDILREREGITVLTPHEGEFVRLTGAPIRDRIRDAQSWAEKLGVILVLKGHETVVTDGKEIYLNSTGNPGMATGGSGDVLAGLISALAVQGLPALQAASCGTWLHGAAGDICARELGQYGMLPTDMLEVLPRLMK